MSAKACDDALNSLLRDVASTVVMECAMEEKPCPFVFKKKCGDDTQTDSLSEPIETMARSPKELAERVLDACRRKRKERPNVPQCLEDERLSRLARFTDKFDLEPFTNFMHYVPRLVNIVTLAEAIPVKGSDTTLPLDLQRVAARCRNSYYAPAKFSAVQLAYSEPRCRVLVFRKWLPSMHVCLPFAHFVSFPGVRRYRQTCWYR